MKLKISRISLLLVIAMLFSIIGSNLVVFADTVDYSSSLTSMHDLGIIDSSVTNVKSVVTRGAFLKSIIESEGLNNAAANSKGSTVFPDITPNSTLSGYINAGLNIGTEQGVNEGVVYGTTGGTYKPNSAVTYAEACTIMVRLLGYTDTDSALQYSSWPNNYIQEAASLNLTTGISLSKFSNLTVGVEAVLFDRLFNSLMKTTTGGTDKFFSDNYYGDTTVTGTLKEVIILGNSTTSDNLADNQVLTSIGTLTLGSGVNTPILGGKYELYVDGTTVTKVTVKENTLVSYVVKSVSNNIISYTDANKKIQTMTLPQASSYYYHGAYVDYDAAVNSVYPSSSIILAKNSNGSGYEYGIIADPNSGNTIVTGTLREAIILGNSMTSDNLAENQILTDIGTLTLESGVTAPILGGKYELYVDGTTVTKIAAEENSLEDYAVKSVSADGLISYTDANNQIETITLPQASAYYYHGKYVDYDTAVNSVQDYSSIVLAKSSNGTGYDYGIIVDPNFGEPYVYTSDNVNLINKLTDTKYDYMYRDDTNITEAQLVPYDVVYFVSDIWSKNTFVYVNYNVVYGEITAFTGNIANPTGLTISVTSGRTSTDETYPFSSYFDKTQLNNYSSNIGNTSTNIGDYKNLVLGVDGSIVDVY
jgi:hypothetical protein